MHMHVVGDGLQGLTAGGGRVQRRVRTMARGGSPHKTGYSLLIRLDSEQCVHDACLALRRDAEERPAPVLLHRHSKAHPIARPWPGLPQHATARHGSSRSSRHALHAVGPWRPSPGRAPHPSRSPPSNIRAAPCARIEHILRHTPARLHNTITRCCAYTTFIPVHGRARSPWVIPLQHHPIALTKGIQSLSAGMCMSLRDIIVMLR